MRDAEEFTLSIRKEIIEGESLYVARVEELPDIEEFADTYEFARELALDSIRTTQRVFLTQNKQFPAPKSFPSEQVSGRVTLRLSKRTHAEAISFASSEGVSLNAYICSCVERANSSHEIKHVMSELHYLKAMVRGVADNQTKNFTQITKLVGLQGVTMRSKLVLEPDERDFTPRESIHRFLVKQDFKYAYD